MDMVRDMPPFNGSPDELSGKLKDLYKKAHQTIKKVTNDIEDRFHFNTAISAIMELVNMMYGIDPEDKSIEKAGVMRFAMESVALLLSPIVPHFSEELWETLGHDTHILLEPWPSFMAEALLEDDLLIVLQVNGKLRSKFTVSADADDDTLRELAISDERAKKFIEGKTIKKVI